MILCTQNAQNYMKREARLFLGTQKSQKSQIRRSQLYESQSDAKFASGRLLRFLREV